MDSNIAMIRSVDRPVNTERALTRNRDPIPGVLFKPSGRIFKKRFVAHPSWATTQELHESEHRVVVYAEANFSW